MGGVDPTIAGLVLLFLAAEVQVWYRLGKLEAISHILLNRQNGGPHGDQDRAGAPTRAIDRARAGTRRALSDRVNRVNRGDGPGGRKE